MGGGGYRAVPAPESDLCQGGHRAILRSALSRFQQERRDMTWYWAGIIAGLVLPFLISPRMILVAFQERGLGIGIAVWSGMLWLSVPFMLAIMWIVHLITGSR
jgi:hypothetical protein